MTSTASARDLRIDPERQHRRDPNIAPEELAEIKRRFEICKNCQHSRDNAFACDLHKGCCFGRWRGNLANHCPASVPRW